jgi:large subunit ribosomal protein L15
MPLHRRIPKRGFTNIFREEYRIVNVDQLEARFEKGAVVDPEALRASRLVRPRTGRVKILGRGEITRPLTVKVHSASAEARKKIEAAGGKVEIL